MQFALLMDDLMRGAQIFQELVAQLYGNFGKGAFAACKQVEVQECLLIARVFLSCVLLEVINETAVQFVLVKELVTLVYNLLVAAASQSFCLLRQPGIVVLLTLCLRMCVDVDTERFMTQHFVGGLVTVAGIIVEEEGQHFAAFDFPCIKVHGLANVCHNLSLLLMDITRWRPSPRCKGME